MVADRPREVLQLVQNAVAKTRNGSIQNLSNTWGLMQEALEKFASELPEYLSQYRLRFKLEAEMCDLMKAELSSAMVMLKMLEQPNG